MVSQCGCGESNKIVEDREGPLQGDSASSRGPKSASLEILQK